MGIVFSHTIAILLLSARRRLRGVSYTRQQNCFISSRDKISEDAIAKISEADNFNELRKAISESVSSIWSSVCSVVYIADSQDLYLKEHRQEAIPHTGIARECLESKEVRNCSNCSSDPIFKALSQHNHFHHDKTSYVSCIPIVDHVSSSVIGVVAIGSIYELSNFDSFDSIKDQIVGCYRRLCKCQRGNSYTPANPSLQNSVSLNGPSDPRDALLRLCGDLYDQDATVLQLKINRFLEEQTNSDCAFHLLVVPETDDLICQVVGSRILQEEVTFPGQNSIFSTALETKKPISLQDTPLDKRKDIEDFLGFTVKSLLCVPVICKNHEGLLALACVTNKDNSDRFSNEDIQIILQCFQYTSTILRSTLAFQNERKLKLQTQAMLQVARNLFTHLGEFSLDHSNILDNYPNLAEFLQMYKEQVPMQSRRKIRSNPYKNSNGSARIEKRNEPIDLLSQQETLANKLSGIEDEVVNKGHSHYVVHPVLKSQAHKSGLGYFDNSKLYQEMDDYKIKSKDPLIGSQKVSLLEENDTKQNMTDNLNLDELDISTEESPGKSDVPVLGSSFEEQKDTTLEIDELKESEGLPVLEDDSTAVGKGLLDVGCVDEAMSQRSYKTALSEDDKTMMYSAIDDTGISECDGENLDSEEYTLSEHYYTDLTTSDLSKVSRTMSETENLDNTGMTDVPVHRRVSDKDFDQPEVRLSNSAPSLSHVNEGSTSTILSTDNVESKPELNYAFLSDSLQSNVDNKGDEAEDEEAENCRSRIILGFDDVIQGSRIDIVVEDTDTDDRVTLSMHKVSTTMPSNVSHVSEVKQPCGSFEETRQEDYNIVKDYHPLSYDDDIITFDDLTKLLREIMQEARNLTQAERCSVFLIDKETDELVAKVFDGITTNDSEEQTEIRMPSTRGIAGHVATTGTLLNIKDAYSHPLFFRGIDDSTGFKTRNILCFPIKNEKGDVLGVAQLCNKKNGPYFTTFDEEVASAFAVYCCISISHCLMYKKLQLSQHRNRLTNELMIYHMQVSYEDVLAHVQNEIPPTVKWSPDFDKFPYPPREIPENDTTLACLTMFEDLGFITRWRIKKETLIRFTLMVKKGYRNPPYHNWMHAFAVAHFCYLCIKNLNLTEYLDDLEMFALFVSCLGHDIDHRGTNNQYQVASKSVLAALYSSEGSVMERHHFAQTMCIVNTEGCNIFENLPSKDYTAVLDLVRDIILATDLAHHLKILGNLKEMASEGYDKTNIKHHKMLLCLLMTASDLSDQTKPWDFTKHVAALIYREFFSQGDLEKALGQRPIEMMDRERARIPDLQIGFLDHIALPVYRVLGDIFPSAESVTNTVVDNRRHWEKICALIKIRRGGSCEQMSYDQILALEEEEADAEIESYQLKQQQAEQNGR